jgi:thioester reductase-like protein
MKRALMKRTLLTGAGGYVGARTAEKLLDATDGGVVLWLHASNRDEAQGKIDALSPRFAKYGDRVVYRFGELTGEAPFASVDPSEIGSIVHSAAVTRFNIDEATAEAVNIQGSAKLFRFAERCAALQDLTYVSTVYASGLAAGPIAEVPLDGAGGFANHYERSKWRGEQLLANEFAHLPWRIARVATVISDDEAGQVTQQNAVHNTLKLLYYGLLSLVPGKADTPLYFVTGEFVADALVAIGARPAAHAIYHLVHRREESLTLDELLGIAFEVFDADEKFKSRRVLRPLYADAESFDILVDGIDSFGGEVFRQALGSVAPFARQLFVKKAFLNDRLRADLPAYAAPVPAELARSVCGQLVRTRWGKASA